jgi:hypothetical protein
MAAKTYPIPEFLFDALSQFRAQQIEMESIDRLVGEKLRERLSEENGEKMTLGEFRKMEEATYERLDRAVKDLKLAHDSVVTKVRHFNFSRT